MVQLMYIPVEEGVRMEHSVEETETNVFNEQAENKLPNESLFVRQILNFKCMLYFELIYHCHQNVDNNREYN